MTNTVLERVRESSQAVEPPPNEWQFLPTSPSVRHLSGDALTLLEDLKADFATEEIEESGLAKRVGDNELQLSPFFSDPALVFMCLWRGKNDGPFDLVSNRRSLKNEQPPCFVACHDYYTKSWLNASRKNLFVAFEMLDVAILRMLKLPVTTAAGLDALDGQKLRLLCGRPESEEDHGGGPETPRRADICHRNVNVALLGWNIAEFKRSPRTLLKPVVSRFAEASQAFDFDVSNVRVWQPTTHLIKRIQLAATLRDQQIVRRSILSTIESSMYDVNTFNNAGKPTPQQPKKDYCAARLELMQEIKRAHELQYVSPELAKKLDNLDEAFDQTVVQPLLEDAASTSDPTEAPLLTSAAELTERLHATSPLMRNAKKCVVRNRSASYEEAELVEPKQRLETINQLIKIRRELRGE